MSAGAGDGAGGAGRPGPAGWAARGAREGQCKARARGPWSGAGLSPGSAPAENRGRLSLLRAWRTVSSSAQALGAKCPAQGHPSPVGSGQRLAIVPGRRGDVFPIPPRKPMSERWFLRKYFAPWHRLPQCFQQCQPVCLKFKAKLQITPCFVSKRL